METDCGKLHKIPPRWEHEKEELVSGENDCQVSLASQYSLISGSIFAGWKLIISVWLSALCSGWWRRRRSTWTSWRRSSRASCAPSRWPPPPRTRPATTRTSTASFWGVVVFRESRNSDKTFLPTLLSLVPPFLEHPTWHEWRIYSPFQVCLPSVHPMSSSRH